jgi:hypothetical protein
MSWCRDCLFMLAALLLLSVNASAQDDPWVDLSIDGNPVGAPSPELESLAPPQHGPNAWPLTITSFVSSRLARTITIPIVCNAGATSSNPDANITVFAYLYVNGSLVSWTSGWGYSPAVHLEVGVEPGLADKTVECHLYAAGASAWASGTLLARSPADLTRAPDVDDTWTYWQLGAYHLYRIWQVWDNYELAWNYANFPVTESYSYGSNGCNLSVEIGGWYTNNQGRFNDTYGSTTPIPACRVVPNCVTYTTQSISVAGKPFSHSVEWRCDRVTIGRN